MPSGALITAYSCLLVSRVVQPFSANRTREGQGSAIVVRGERSCGAFSLAGRWVLFEFGKRGLRVERR